MTLFHIVIFSLSYEQVRVEYVKAPENHIPEVLSRVKKEYIVKTYGIDEWESPEHFLEQVAKKGGRLLKVDSTLSFSFSSEGNL